MRLNFCFCRSVVRRRYQAVPRRDDLHFTPASRAPHGSLQRGCGIVAVDYVRPQHAEQAKVAPHRLRRMRLAQYVNVQAFVAQHLAQRPQLAVRAYTHVVPGRPLQTAKLRHQHLCSTEFHAVHGMHNLHRCHQPNRPSAPAASARKHCA